MVPAAHRPAALQVAMQPKVMSGPVNHTAAPPVYRPAALQVAMQPKVMSGPVNRSAAPPVYRPAAPHVTVQPKVMSGPVNRTAAPPVYRPAAPHVTVQPKVMLAGPVNRSAAPPVYRATSSDAAQCMSSPSSVRPFSSGPAKQSSISLVPLRPILGATSVQRLRFHAIAYVEQNGIDMPTVTKETVERYVKSKENPLKFRLGLLQAWNTKNQRTKRPQPAPIEVPSDLKPKPVTAITEKQNTLVDWDSDDDDNKDIDSLLTSNTSQKVILYRSSTRTRKRVEAPVVPLSVAVRYGRQAVKRREVNERFGDPIVTKLNEHYIEFAAPRDNDVVAFRLKPDDDGDLLRQGGVGTWDDIAKQLDRELEKDAEARTRKRKRLSGPFEGTFAVETETEAEAVGAIACDFIKGSGNWDFVDAINNAPEDSKPTDLFSGSKRIYKPAGPLGRQLATAATKKKKLALKKKRQPTPVPVSIAGRTVHNVAGDGMDCLIRAILYSALGAIDESHVTIIRNHLVTQGVAVHEQMLDLARAAGSILITFMVLQGILNQSQGIEVYVPDGNGGIAPPIVVLGGGNRIQLWLSNEHFRAIR
jgi:hypothetical protein